MKLKIITCSGTNEYTDIRDLVDLLTEYPIAEAGIQTSSIKCSFATPRFEWIHHLAAYLYEKKQIINLALHMNQDWVENFCFGIIAPELEDILNLSDYQGNKLIKRIQLNFKIGREKTPEIETLVSTIKKFPEQRFILSYNSSNAELIRQIYERQIMFDNLFDASFGAGIIPSERPQPTFTDRLQGYAGGLGTDNIYGELSKIANHVSPATEIYIDAQGKLENENQHLCLDKCHHYILNALYWQKGYETK